MSINRTMIMLDDGSIRFVFRIVGVLLYDNHVLLHRAEQDDFWSLPGGRAELLEPSRETLKREMQEELGVDVTVENNLTLYPEFLRTALQAIPQATEHVVNVS